MQSVDDKKLKDRDRVAIVKKHWVRLTNFCNNHCVFCLDSQRHDGKCILEDEIKASLEAAFKNNFRRVVLSGGEPTIHPDFLQIVKLAKKIGYTHIQVITNGRLFFYEDFLKEAVKNGLTEATFSIHGDNPRLHDAQTMVKGSFLESVTGLKNALKIPGFIVSVDVVINKLNYRNLRRILDYFVTLGVREFDLLQTMPTGSAWENRDKLFYTFSAAAPYLYKALELSRNPGLHLWTNRFPARYLEGYENLIQHPKKLHEEVLGRREMFAGYFRRGIKMYCYGERCLFCVLSGLCNDILILKKNNFLYSREAPACLKNVLKTEKKDLKLSDVLKKNSLNLALVTDFYIQYRYFAKSKRCVACLKNGSCDGAPVNFIRKHGFARLGFDGRQNK